MPARSLRACYPLPLRPPLPPLLVASRRCSSASTACVSLSRLSLVSVMSCTSGRCLMASTCQGEEQLFEGRAMCSGAGSALGAASHGCKVEWFTWSCTTCAEAVPAIPQPLGHHLPAATHLRYGTARSRYWHRPQHQRRCV